MKKVIIKVVEHKEIDKIKLPIGINLTLYNDTIIPQTSFDLCNYFNLSFIEEKIKTKLANYSHTNIDFDITKSNSVLNTWTFWVTEIKEKEVKSELEGMAAICNSFGR